MMVALLRDGEAVGSWIFDPLTNRLAVAELGWSPDVPLRQTLADTMETIRYLRRSAGLAVRPYLR